MSYKTETIKSAVLNVSNNKYLLPAIQRELVWSSEQIEKLFDSILSSYPFGSMLLWKYKKEENNLDYKFYEFIKKYDEYDKKSNHNKEHNINGKEEVVGVLDGQQRMTALFLGLKGSLNLHKPRRRYDNSNNYEEKYLYINLLYKKTDVYEEYDDIKPEYQLKFKTKIELANAKKNTLWFKVGEILEWNEKKDWKNIIQGKDITDGQRDNIENICVALYDNFCKYERISYYEEKTKSLDRVLNIFVRINSGGTSLDYTDFLMSLIINQWGDGREAINNAIDNIINCYRFDIPKDIFLRGCLFLTDADLKFKADNFKQNTIKEIKKHFKKIEQSIQSSCKIFNDFGYTKDNLRSNLILLPLALFLMKNDLTKLDDENSKKVKKWIQLSILNRVFSSQTTRYLTKLRKESKWEINFPFEDIKKISKVLNRDIDIKEDMLEDIIEKAKKGSQDSWALLTLIYPSHNYKSMTFEEDHIYPYSKLSAKQKAEGGNYIANVQLLPNGDNQSKSNQEPNEWMEKFCKQKSINIEDYRKNNFIPPNIKLIGANFDKFIERRKELIKERILQEIEKG